MIIAANHITLFYEKTGVGAPLLLLHGNGEDHRIFDKLAAKLARDFTIYAIDSRNHGQSMQTEDYAYETMAEDVHAFIEALGLKKAHIIGFSDGAIIGLLLAMRHAEDVAKMALLGINLKPEDFTEESRQSLVDAYAETKDPLLGLMLTQPNIELEAVRKVQHPVLLLAAENDVFKPETFTHLAEALPHAKLRIMAGHGHDSYIVNQDLLYPEFVFFFMEDFTEK